MRPEDCPEEPNLRKMCSALLGTVDGLVMTAAAFVVSLMAPAVARWWPHGMSAFKNVDCSTAGGAAAAPNWNKGATMSFVSVLGLVDPCPNNDT